MRTLGLATTLGENFVMSDRLGNLKRREQEAILHYFLDSRELQRLLSSKVQSVHGISSCAAIFRKFFADKKPMIERIERIFSQKLFVLDFIGSPFSCDAETSEIDPMQLHFAPEPPFTPWETRLCAISVKNFLNRSSRLHREKRITYRDEIKYYADKHGVHFDDLPEDELPFFAGVDDRPIPHVMYAHDAQVLFDGKPVGVAMFDSYAAPLWKLVHYTVSRLIREELLVVGHAYGAAGKLESLSPWKL